MNYSIETLRTFVETASLKSFSAAARKLNKSQSTISNTISNFEDDMGVILFDRKGRESSLTCAGKKVLNLAKDILSANEHLQILRNELSPDTELQLSVAFSEIYQPTNTEYIFTTLDKKFPHVEFEFLLVENNAVIEMIKNQRAQIGMVESREEYPADISFSRLPVQGEFGLYVSKTHPLAQEKKITSQHLKTTRQLKLSNSNQTIINSEKCWLAPNYLLLLEIAEQGMGWSILPTWLVKQFGHNQLINLKYDLLPCKTNIDLIWSQIQPPGKIGYWLINTLLNNQK